MNMRLARSRRVLGGTLLGLVVGLLLGLGIALAVAIYVTKVPVPLVDRGLVGKPEQDAAEAARNRGWNPNANLGGGPTTPPPVPTVVSPTVPPATPPAAAAAPEAVPAAPERDPIAELLQSRERRGQAEAEPAAAPPADPFIYYVQVGAFRSLEDAESQRARVAMLGMTAEITERVQGNQPVFRVRIGPFDQRDVADALVRVYR
jgi:cell division protein FtsN